MAAFAVHDNDFEGGCPYDYDKPVPTGINRSRAAAAAAPAARSCAIMPAHERHPPGVITPERHRLIEANLLRHDKPYWPVIPVECLGLLHKVLWPIVLAYAAPRPVFKEIRLLQSAPPELTWRWEDMPHEFILVCDLWDTHPSIKSRLPGSNYAWHYSNQRADGYGATLQIVDAFDNRVVSVTYFPHETQVTHVGGGMSKVERKVTGVDENVRLPIVDRSCNIKGDMRVLVPVLKMLIEMIKRKKRIDALFKFS
jgi:hypothetical protein